ncbi:DUF4115 domain-containing protein [Nocardioides marmoriginsengisoli]|uniref:DUF4115 domain-containing protein n=1 Tax=Nocardioides marmoriginsengisoli TaxID=661483 RepID=A0A3N0CNK2_9ACTN|nr:RodZ domain-containing protein [Nocardioides marmoriginsengisoli]RNL65047.1 DUF4115 domain-containing protein [Nocardioides marmoriginsengisoli]
MSDTETDAVHELEHDENLLAVHRNVLLSGVVGGLALVLGLGYLIRGSSFFDALIGLLLLAVAALNLPAVVAARTPVLVVDDQGIRFRIGFSWRGLPWQDVRQVVVESPETLLREGRLVIVPRDRSATADYQGPVAQAHLRWNQYWYGAPVALPLGMTTVTDSIDLAADLDVLAAGRTEVVGVQGRQLAPLDEVQPRPAADPVAVASAYGAETVEAPVPEEPALPGPVLPLRDLHRPARVEARLEAPEEAPEEVPEDEPVVPDQADAVLDPSAEDTGPVVLAIPEQRGPDQYAPEQHVPEPVIGQKVRHAREMLDMSIDELSQRTRIRPHVLEAIELDDFAPCGGDFYARGHLTAVSRVLGLSLEPLMKLYDERYAQAPINARRVFEAELSTGLSGGMRATLGGPRWSLVIGAVLSLTMIWGLARMLAGDPEQLNAAPEETSQTAGLAANRTPITSARMKTSTMTVKAVYAGTRVVVRDRTGKILWSGDLAIRKQRKIVGLAPFKVSADNAGAVEVTVKGKALGTVGTAGAAGSKTFR